MTTCPIAGIHVGERHRTDLGDIDTLAKSIATVGLLHPIVIDRQLHLVAGRRRLEAVKRLGWLVVPVTSAKGITDAAAALIAERDENTCRKDMTPSELVALTEALMELERPAAEARAKAGVPLVSADTGGPVRDIAARAAGWSPSTFQRARDVIAAQVDPDPKVQAVAVKAVEDMDTGKVGVNSAHQTVLRVRHKQGGECFSDVIKGRRDQIRDLYANGNSAFQIAETLNLHPKTVKKIADELGIDRTADQILGRGKTIDPNRVIDEMVGGLEGYCIGLDLIDPKTADPDQVEAWSGSIRKSISRLQRLLKEMNRA